MLVCPADGFRKDAKPITGMDIYRVLNVINNDPSPTFTGELSCAELPLIKFVLEIDGVIYKVIGEIRPGGINRNVAVYNMYKR